MTRARDRLYADPHAEIEAFAFDQRVADVFEDMIRRSVPGYGLVVSMTGVLAGRYAQPGTWCYDLGCSLGASSAAMRSRIAVPDVRILGVDNSLSMLAQCRRNLETEDTSSIPVDLICADIRDLTIANASVVALNFTLQFVVPEGRADLLTAIHKGLHRDGVLILSEKTAAQDPLDNALLTELHHDFKRANGYSDLEISQKRAALDRVLVPEALESHIRRLEQVGFRRVVPWLQCLNFFSLVAFR